MIFKEILNSSVQQFIKDNEHKDVSKLALSTKDFNTELRLEIFNQIKAKQKIKNKLPDWCNIDGIIFPPLNTLEQSSSRATALYKASLFNNMDTFVDLTGGAGVDSAALSRSFMTGFCIESNTRLSSLLAHNLPLLTNKKITVVNSTAEAFIKQIIACDLTYIDPQRREKGRKGIYRLDECSPNVLHIIPLLKDKAKQILIKTSPMLDINSVLQAITNVMQVHVVEYDSDCKEVLYLIQPDYNADPKIYAVSLSNEGRIKYQITFSRNEERMQDIHYSDPLRYIYEPGPAFMKSGGFKTMAATHNLKKLHTNTHLYTSNTYKDTFPGRHFRLIQVLPVDKKAVLAALGDNKANVSIRNHPGSAKELSKTLKLHEGGDQYIMACTIGKNRHVLLWLNKI